MTETRNHKERPSVSQKSDTEDYLFSDKSDNYTEKKASPYQRSEDFFSFSNGYNFMPASQKKAVPVMNKPQLNALNSINNPVNGEMGTEQKIEAQQNDSVQNIDDDHIWTDEIYDETDRPNGLFAQFLFPILFIITAITWTGFFIWSNLTLIQSGITASDVSTLIIDWATPTILVLLGWLLVMRSSKAEAKRFADVSNGLHKEAQNVQNKIREVNEDVALARDFLMQYSQDLEHIGRSAAMNITKASEKIETALNESNDKADRLEQVSAATNKNLELLRKNLPVVNSAAKDATNMIGKAGMEAIDQIRSLKNVIEENSQSSAKNRSEIELLAQSNEKITQDMQRQSADVREFTEAMIGQTREQIEKIAATIKDEYQNFEAVINETSDNLAAKKQQITDSLTDNIAKLSAAMNDLTHQNAKEDTFISNMITTIQDHIIRSEQQIDILSDRAIDQTAKMAFAMTALKENSDNVGQGLSDNQKQAAILIEQSENVLLALDSNSREMDETIPTSVQRLEDLFISIDERFAATFDNIGRLSKYSDDIKARYADVDKQLALATDQIENLSQKQSVIFDRNSDKVQKILESLNKSKALISQITEKSDGAFADQIKNINIQIDDSIEYSRQSISETIESSSKQLTQTGASIIQSTVEKQVAAIENNLKNSLNTHIEAASGAIEKLQSQLVVIEQMTENMEKRIKDNAEDFATVGDESFSRQMALLTESLNSTAIDVAKIISNDVTDNAWAAYLKGDRGVFTRRAVKLLTSNEAKLILSHYEENIEFHDHVNRYIHDFEAMMRVLLSTRDGNSIGVTLLSSDVGKLYVALAQAIERLRQ